MLLALLCLHGAQAIVGPTGADPLLASHMVMVLKRSSAGSGFCSGVVVGRRSILTAGHCVADATALTIDAPGAAPGLFAVDASAVHPLYRADAARRRERSVDLALIHLAAPLPAAVVPATLSTIAHYDIGAPLRLAGFGEAIEGDGASGGQLRMGRVMVRAPLSSLLLWLVGTGGQKTGACEGDSGGATFDAAGHLAAIIDWAEGDGASQCGSLTQSALVAPQQAWIRAILIKWHEP